MTNFCWRNFYVHCSARAAFWSYVIASYLSNRIFKIFNSKWSYDKMLIDWVRSGRSGKYLALGQEVRTWLRSLRTPWPRAKYFPVRPSHSVNKYILFNGLVFIVNASPAKQKIKQRYFWLFIYRLEIGLIHSLLKIWLLWVFSGSMPLVNIGNELLC